MKYIFLLNEFTLLKFFTQIVLKRQVYILNNRSIFPPLQKFIDCIASWALNSGRAEHVVENLTPNLKPYWEYDRRFHFHEAFKKYESWQDAYYQLNNAEKIGEPYTYGYKLSVSNYTFPKVLDIYLVQGLLKNQPADSMQICGLMPDTLDMYISYFQPFDDRLGLKTMSLWCKTLNTLSALSVLAYSIVWTCFKIRIFSKTCDVFFAADNLNDPRDSIMYDEISDGGKVLVVSRNSSLSKNVPLSAKKYLQCTFSDGFFPVGDAVKAIVLLVSDSIRLWKNYSSHSPELFYRVITMPYKRIIIRCLFNRYRPKFFWGRDDYNVEHILRRWELNRIGGKSLGVNHAVVTNFCSLIAMWRYISFDVYYTFGIPLCQPYVSRWDQSMELRSAGMFGVSRKTLAKEWPLGKAILVAVRVAWYEPEMANIVTTLARKFPDKEILLQMKAGYLDEEKSNAYIADWCKGLPNVRHVTDNIYVLLEDAEYLVSDISSLIAEGIQLGLKTFFADVIEQEYSIFREFPGLSLKSADSIADKIDDIENGTTKYPTTEYIKFMGLEHGLNIYDIVRNDVGLPPVISNADV